MLILHQHLPIVTALLKSTTAPRSDSCSLASICSVFLCKPDVFLNLLLPILQLVLRSVGANLAHHRVARITSKPMAGSRPPLSTNDTPHWVTCLFPCNFPEQQSKKPRRLRRCNSIPWVKKGMDWVWILGSEIGVHQHKGHPPSPSPHSSSAHRMGVPIQSLPFRSTTDVKGPEMLRGKAADCLTQVPTEEKEVVLFEHTPVKLPPWIRYGQQGGYGFWGGKGPSDVR